MTQPDSVAAIIDLLAAEKLLGALGLEPGHARVMKARNAIPGHWHRPIVELARDRGLPIDYELLAALAATKRKNSRAKIVEDQQGIEG